MSKRDIIVIGGSVGSLSVLKDITSKLPSGFPAAVFIVWHMAPNSPGLLPEILTRQGALPAVHAQDFEKFEPGRIYVAPPDRHLLIEDSRVRISKGPRENRFRPAIDPLFRSAAQAYGERVVGVILSGGLDDGTAGLWTIKEFGGTAIIQDPSDAENSSMPLSARRKVRVDHIVPGKDIANLLIRLCNEEALEEKRIMSEKPEKNEIEIGIAGGDEALRKGVLELGPPSYFTCPDCHGVMVEIVEDKNIRFRCHTGHAFSSGTLLAEVTESIEDSLWNTIRAMDENVLLLRHLGEHLKTDDAELATIYVEEAERIERRSQKIRETLRENHHIYPPE
ncbi:MAG TPA: chemotaxis protein CheB [Pyrinomonadaceae bacterium]|jgi:two-component system chemotaxis response regulator CheB